MNTSSTPAGLKSLETTAIDTSALERPSPKLLTYYLLTGLLTGPGMIVAIPALIIRYNTLRYRFEESGLRMQLGLFFRKEVVVAFRRIQDIHVNRNLIQRWLGIASVSVQTASGNAMPEIVLEGMTDPDSIRDWLYERMRGAKGYASQTASHSAHSAAASALGNPSAPPILDQANEQEVTALLRGIRDNLALMAEKSTRSPRSES
jgi:uncharacterized protein